MSPGCANCYAESYAKRFRSTVPFNVITLNEHRLGETVRWTRPRKIFVGSLTDPFHAAIPNEYRDRIFLEFILGSRHTYQVLTKRIDLAADYLAALESRPSLVGAGLNAAYLRDAAYPLVPAVPIPDAWAQLWPLPNLWLGVTAENEFWAMNRIPALLKLRVRVPFVSFEPLLGPIPAGAILPGIAWCIVGGESGPNARPFDPYWARIILKACQRKRIAFFMKQLGGWPKKRDSLTDFPPDLQVREFPAVA